MAITHRGRPATRPRGPGPAALAGVIALAAGCGDDGPDVRYHLVGLPRATATGCAPAIATPPEVPGATRVRLTFRDTTDAGIGPLRCDIVLPLGTPPPQIAVPRRAEPVAVWAEYFDDAGTLLARGGRDRIAIDDGDTVTIAIAPIGDYACARVQTTTARAFHSATVLPTGEVLLLGGLTGSPTAPGASFAPDDGAYALGTAELYDPVGGTTRPIAIPGLIPRAFHQTVVVGEDAAGVHLLVIGGSGVNSVPTLPGNVAAIPGGSGAPPWQPATPDIARGRFGARALPAELLTYRPGNRTFTRVEVGAGGPAARVEAGANSATLGGGPIAVVGGRVTGGAATTLVEAVRSADGIVAGTANGRPRVGATVTMLAGGDAVVIGGDVGPDLAAVRAVEHLTGLDGTPTIGGGPTDTSAMNRAYHAAAVSGDSVLMVGGLHLSGATVEDQGPAALVARISTGNFAATALDSGGAPAVAYLDAATLHDRGVLAVGGARPGGACARTVLCPTSSSLRFDEGGSSPVGSGALGLARYGHRLTRLADGTVVVTGGFALDPVDPSRLQATTAVEQFEAHRVADDPLADVMTRAPGDLARDPQGQPLAECVRVGVTAPVIDAAVDAAIDAP